MARSQFSSAVEPACRTLPAYSGLSPGDGILLRWEYNAVFSLLAAIIFLVGCESQSDLFGRTIHLPEGPPQSIGHQRNYPSEPTEFARLVHDFGNVPTNSTFRHEFQIVNGTDSVWQVQRVDTTCRCTHVQISADSIAPGDALRAIVEYHSGSGVKDDLQRVTLHAISGPPIVLDLAARVREPMVVQFPRHEIELACGERRTLTFTVDNYSHADWSRLECRDQTDDGGVQTRFIVVDEPETAPRDVRAGLPRQRWTCAVDVAVANAAPGRYLNRVELVAYDAFGSVERSHATIRCVVRPPIQIVPGIIFFAGDVVQDAVIEKSLLFRFTGIAAPQKSGDVGMSHDLPWNVTLSWSDRPPFGEAVVSIGPITGTNQTVRGTVTFSFGESARMKAAIPVILVLRE